MIDINGILDLLPHRYPFLMVDRVIAVEPGISVTAIKCVSVNEPQFQGHFPGKPIMPGVLITEAFAQVSGLVALTEDPDRAGARFYLLGLDRIRFRKVIIPGDRVEITATKINARRHIWTFKCVAKVDGKRVADGTVMAALAPEGEGAG
jgi:3-hydroxyacyl-[acyl-carrier-protein] dehydratase